MDVCLFVATAALSRYSSYRYEQSLVAAKQKKELSLSLLKEQNAETSSAIIEHYSNNSLFRKLSRYEGDLTVQRDDEDASKLQIGIQFAQSKGVIDPLFVPEPYTKIDVLGKSPDQVADLILKQRQAVSNNSNNNVIVIVGLSGTGKGTTVSALYQKLEDQGHVVTTWSNGNIFRSVTLLAATWCQQNCTPAGDFNADQACSKDNIASFMNMLSFGKNPRTGNYDTRIQGLGIDAFVSEIQNTTLKLPLVSKNIPTVAQFTQGEVILFAADAVYRMGQDGIFVLLEGREQTVDYVRSPNRFCLHLSDESLIGKRRAAQRLMAQALHHVQQNGNSNDDSSSSICVQQVLDQALEEMVQDVVQ